MVPILKSISQISVFERMVRPCHLSLPFPFYRFRYRPLCNPCRGERIIRRFERIRTYGSSVASIKFHELVE